MDAAALWIEDANRRIAQHVRQCHGELPHSGCLIKRGQLARRRYRCDDFYQALVDEYKGLFCTGGTA